MRICFCLCLPVLVGAISSALAAAEADREVRSVRVKGVVSVTPSVQRFAGEMGEWQERAAFERGQFALEEKGVVVFMGQTDMVRSRLDGSLEAILAHRFAEEKPRFRNMAWESDTVYEQWRDIDFGSWEDQLNAVGATTVIVQFGQMEVLEGVGSLGRFIEAYEQLLDRVARQTKRLVLLSPRLFEQPLSPHMPDHRGKNGTVRQYANAIRGLANRRAAVFVDLTDLDQETADRLTLNGIHLTANGLPAVARRIAQALGVESGEVVPRLQEAVVEKNRLWFDNWRPMNWSFAYGDRTSQRFSQASGNRPPLKVELEDFKSLIRQADHRIHQLALGREIEAVQPAITRPTPAMSKGHSPEAELASFRVMDGFEVNLFASEGDGVVKPVQMRWDDRGRLWVICTPTYPHIEPGLKPGDYILICEDTDGDGKADKFDRFAEGLFIPMGLEFADGGVYVTEATELVHLTDSDGDGKADRRRVVLSGFGTADSHQMVNGLERGPFGDFWFTQGHHVYSRVETPWGISKLEKSGVWRYRPRTGKLEGFFNLSKAGLNCQGVTHDDWGQTFHNSAAISGGFYTTVGAVSTDRTRVISPLTPNPSRNTGIEFIGTRHLPGEMQGQVIWGGYMSNTIQIRELMDEGAGFRAEKRPDLIQSDRREFRPVNVKIGPDGAIYVCDWYNPTIGHYQASYRDPKRDRTHGRIWRVESKSKPLVKRPKLEKMTTRQLLQQLDSPERLTRVNAKKRLFDLPTEAVVPLVDEWLDGLNSEAPNYAQRLYEASGLLAAHEVVRPDLIDVMIQLEEPRIRAIGARLIGRWANGLDNPLALLRLTALDPHPRVRMETILACTHIAAPEAIEVAATALDLPRDRFIDYAFSLAVHALRPHWLAALNRGQLDFGGNQLRLRAVLDEDGSADTLSLVRRLAEEGDSEFLISLIRLGDASDLSFCFRVGLENPNVLHALLEAARVHGKKPDGDLKPFLQQILSSNEPSMEALGIALIDAWKVQTLAEPVKVRLLKPACHEAVRLAAIESAPFLFGRDGQPWLERFLVNGQSESIRLAALRSLALVNESRASEWLLERLPTLDSANRMAPFVGAFIQGPERAALLAEAIRRAALDQDSLMRLQHSLGILGRSYPPLEAAIREAQGLVSKAPAEYDEQIVKNLKYLVESVGDFARGRMVYDKSASCVACHKIHGEGGDIGPDLSEVGSGRSLELLIESVLWPNRQIREGYMTTLITTKDGQQVLGYRLSEEGGEVSLRDLASLDIRKVARAHIQTESEAGSAMIAGLTDALTDAELADLITYLSGLKKK